MKKSLFLRILVLIFISFSGAHASLPDFLNDLNVVYKEFATEIVIGLVVIALWIIAGITASARSSATPLKWAVVGTVFIIAAPYVAPDALTWAQTQFGTK